MRRAFVAIRPPDVVLDAIGERMAAAEMRGERASTREQWHVTIQFLGDDIGKISLYESALRADGAVHTVRSVVSLVH